MKFTFLKRGFLGLWLVLFFVCCMPESFAQKNKIGVSYEILKKEVKHYSPNQTGNNPRFEFIPQPCSTISIGIHYEYFKDFFSLESSVHFMEMFLGYDIERAEFGGGSLGSIWNTSERFETEKFRSISKFISVNLTLGYNIFQSNNDLFAINFYSGLAFDFPVEFQNLYEKNIIRNSRIYNPAYQIYQNGHFDTTYTWTSQEGFSEHFAMNLPIGVKFRFPFFLKGCLDFSVGMRPQTYAYVRVTAISAINLLAFKGTLFFPIGRKKEPGNEK